MMSTSLRGSFILLGQEIRLLWLWWIEQLRSFGMALLALLVPSFRCRTLIMLERTGGQVSVLQGGQFKALFTFRKEPTASWPDDLRPFGSAEVIHQTRAIIALSSDFTFSHDLVLPDRTERELSRIIPLYLERDFPLTLNAISFTYSISQRLRATRQIVVNIVIVRRRDLDASLAAAQSWHLIPVQVGAVDKVNTARGNFMELPMRSTHRWARTEKWMFAICIILGLSAVTTLAAQWLYERSQVKQALSEAQLKADAVMNAAKILEVELAPVQRLATIRREADAAAIVTTLTERTPADTWIYQLLVEAVPDKISKLTLSTITPTSLEYLKTLENAPEFEHVSLISVASDSGNTSVKNTKLTTVWTVSSDPKQAPSLARESRPRIKLTE